MSGTALRGKCPQKPEGKTIDLLIPLAALEERSGRLHDETDSPILIQHLMSALESRFSPGTSVLGLRQTTGENPEERDRNDGEWPSGQPDKSRGLVIVEISAANSRNPGGAYLQRLHFPEAFRQATPNHPELQRPSLSCTKSSSSTLPSSSTRVQHTSVGACSRRGIHILLCLRR